MSRPQQIKFFKHGSFIIKMSFTLLFIVIAQALRIHNPHQGTSHVALQKIQQNHFSKLNSYSHKLPQKVYDEQRYLIQLAQKQNDFKSKIIEIQNDFSGINLMLNDTNLSQNQKRIKLTEAMADQRDALISAQNQLNIPYELKACQCLNLTEQKRRDIQAQIEKVGAKIRDLEARSQQSNSHCAPHECPLMEEVNQQILMMKNYQSIMQMTISSRCCKVINYEYRDNLDTLNWHFGNTTQSQYQAAILRREMEKDIKLQPCPYSAPFVNLQKNSCFNCPEKQPLFNLGTRQCQKDCSTFSGNQYFSLNITTHVCGYNTNCPEGQFFDQLYKKCVPTPNYYNQSSCPPNRPFWDSSTYSCQACPSDTPYFDAVLKKCRKCYEEQSWDQNLRICQQKIKCPEGQRFDSNVKRCVKIQNNTHSQCPPSRPYWNEQTYSCDTCPAEKPYYDAKKGICRQCTSQQIFKPYSKQCVPIQQHQVCADNELYNASTNRCEKKGTTSMCPPSTPYWDSVNYKCLKCPIDRPVYNNKTKQCQTCPYKSIWSTLYQACVQECGSDQEWNKDYKKCIKKDKSCPQKFAFSFELNKCIEINCNEATPYWNVTANQCQNCPPGTVYNYLTNYCEANSRSGNVSVCHEDKPLWNPDYLRCQPCPSGTQWDQDIKDCLDVPARHHSKQTFKERRGSVSQRHKKESKYGRVMGNVQVSYQYQELPQHRRYF